MAPRSGAKSAPACARAPVRPFSAVAPRGRTYSRFRPTAFDRAYHHHVRTFYRVRDALDHHRGGAKSAFSTRCDGDVQHQPTRLPAPRRGSPSGHVGRLDTTQPKHPASRSCSASSLPAVAAAHALAARLLCCTPTRAPPIRRRGRSSPRTPPGEHSAAARAAATAYGASLGASTSRRERLRRRRLHISLPSAPECASELTVRETGWP